MKALKKLIAGIFAFTIVFAMMTAKDSIRVSADSVSAGNTAVVMTVDQDSCDWDYSTDANGDIVLNRYNGSSARIKVPASINGKKVRKIGKEAFASQVIREISIPEGIYTIGEGAFHGCCGLRTLKLPESLATIGEGAFAKSSIEKINIPSSVLSVPKNAFADSCISSVEFSDGLVRICEDAFRGCDGLEKVDLPSTLRFIEAGAFRESSLQTVQIPSGVKAVERSTFEDSAVSYVVISENVKYIGDRAFAGCRDIRAVKLPEDLESIGNGAFANSGIVDADIPAGVGYIGNNAYSGSNLEELTFRGVPDMASAAFRMCTKLKNINVDPDAEFDGSVFNGCLDLMKINGFTVNGSGSKGQPFFNGIIRDCVLRNFRGSTDVGFMKRYVTDEAGYIVSTTVTDDMSEVEKIAALQKWICDKVAYNWDDVSDAANYADSSVFLNDFTVCDGYARGMAILLQKAGFEVYYVANDIHAWDIVKVGDHYFHIDVTYADAFSNELLICL